MAEQRVTKNATKARRFLTASVALAVVATGCYCIWYRMCAGSLFINSPMVEIMGSLPPLTACFVSVPTTAYVIVCLLLVVGIIFLGRRLKLREYVFVSVGVLAAVVVFAALFQASLVSDVATTERGLRQSDGAIAIRLYSVGG